VFQRAGPATCTDDDEERREEGEGRVGQEGKEREEGEVAVEE